MTMAFAAGDREAGYRWLTKACDDRCFELLDAEGRSAIRRDYATIRGSPRSAGRIGLG